jgi:hypothetical protein
LQFGEPSMDLRWLASAAASSFHAVSEMLRGGNLLDSALGDALTEPVSEFQELIGAIHVDPRVLADHLTALSIDGTNLEQQAQIAIRKTAGEFHAGRLATPVARWMRSVQTLFSTTHPDALAELELRSGPLREQWEARGPGLMARLRSLVGWDSLPESADVILVQPVVGGGGTAHIAYNRVSFEAVLANPVAELPEVIRLGWLLGQLQLDLPEVQGQLSRQRLLAVGELATIPAILAAAHDVELTGPVAAVLSQALDTWRLPKEDADALFAWWETYCEKKTEWGTALAALDRLEVARSPRHH